MPGSLDGKVALVAGATRGAGRGIAVALGEAGATVYCTGRSTRASSARSTTGPETIEETAELVDAAGGARDRGRGRPPATRRRCAALVARIDAEQGRLDVLVNDIWGGENLVEWNTPVWEHDLDDGLRLLRLAIDTHLITSHFALPLLIRRPGGLVVEMTDGTPEYNAAHLPAVDLLRPGQDVGASGSRSRRRTSSRRTAAPPSRSRPAGCARR